ncbi:transcription factor [Grosmannia clavigera kw1407]|uniref:Transcription factor n=1 Tax=Grosmannia clavigera (strain kw1407 / UAMH 11150) TaxID=655863 RepID=F0XGQ6_GROCL|nr:transcription factor [Grosmannia clavigera kw1407]EFX02691.1 transcription factor [Grosmannia clavigera kw1407]
MAASTAAAGPIGLSPISDEKGFLYATPAVPVVGAQNSYGLETGWQTPCSMDSNGGLTRNHSISSELGIMGMDDQTQHSHISGFTARSGDLYATNLPWTSPADLSASQFPEASLGMHMGVHSRSQSFDFSMPATPGAGVGWIDSPMVDMYGYGQNPMHTPASMDSSSNNYIPSPATTPSMRQSPPVGHESVPMMASHDSSGGVRHRHRSRSDCPCFSTCLNSLQALHNASSPTAPAFDVVLKLNSKAVEGCSAMLGCPRCMSRSGTHTAAMLLATVIGKITSFYKYASQTYFSHTSNGMDSAMYGMGTGGTGEVDCSSGYSSSSSPQSATAATTAAPTATMATGLGVSLGAYQLQGEDGRWLQLQILNRELHKLEDVYTRFRQVCGDLSEDVEMSKAMIGYLGQTLGSTLDLVNHRKGDLRYA